MPILEFVNSVLRVFMFFKTEMRNFERKIRIITAQTGISFQLLKNGTAQCFMHADLGEQMEREQP
jgi:hypothetical protein